MTVFYLSSFNTNALLRYACDVKPTNRCVIDSSKIFF